MSPNVIDLIFQHLRSLSKWIKAFDKVKHKTVVVLKQRDYEILQQMTNIIKIDAEKLIPISGNQAKTMLYSSYLCLQRGLAAILVSKQRISLSQFHFFMISLKESQTIFCCCCQSQTFTPC